MKALFFLALIGLAFAFEQKEIVDYINNNDFGWKAKEYEMWDHWTVDELKQYFSLRKPESHNLPIVNRKIKAATTWDWRTQKPNCDWDIRNQGQCGSCWAFGLAESCSDRACIQGSQNIKLAAQDPVSCDSSNYGCNGGYLNLAWEYAVNTGLVLQSCFPYVSGDGSVPPCPSSCPGTGSWTKYKMSNAHQVSSSEDAIMTEVQTNGPAEFSMAVYQDFMDYTSGVYKHESGQLLGYHAIKGVGWGVSGGEKYWIIANSWGTSWGINGYFWILKGVNECEIEGGVYCGDYVGI
jgi:cathepsin B